MKKIQKTNAMRFLDQHKVEYEAHTYEHKDGDPVDGVHVASILNQPVERVYKTLVTQANTKEYLVYMLPVEKELDLKKAAKAVGEKSIEMIKSKELLPLTGYVHGGCSPIGMKKFFPTTFHKTAEDFETIMFSAGKIGHQVEVKLSDVDKVIRYQIADIVTD